MLFPFYWMVITAFKRDRDLYNLDTAPFWFKEPPTLDHLELLLVAARCSSTWLKNSLMIGVLVVVITLLLALPAAYALARMRFPGASRCPPRCSSPTSSRRRCCSSRSPSWCAGSGSSTRCGRWSSCIPSFTLPFCTWLLMGFVRTVPREIEESAQIDGCTRFQAFRMIIIPVIVPGIITAGIFAFTLTYQEFIYALTFISASANKTISYGVTSDLIRGDVFYWGSLMSGALIGAIPVAIVYAFSLDHFIHGLTAGALK